MHTQPYMPPPPERLPWESVPKQLTVRQVHEHGGTPTETGRDLTEQTSQSHQTHYQPKHTRLTGPCIHSSDLSRPQPITLTCSQHSSPLIGEDHFVVYLRYPKQIQCIKSIILSGLFFIAVS